MVSVNEFPIATANEIPGFKIIETKGFVYGLTVRSRGVGGQVSAGLRSLVGGEIKEYVSMMEVLSLTFLRVPYGSHGLLQSPSPTGSFRGEMMQLAL